MRPLSHFSKDEVIILPFLKRRQVAAPSVHQFRKPDDQNEPKEDEGLMAAAKDLIAAVQSNDAKRVAQAIRSAFELLEQQPHEEAEHDEYVESEQE